jgi:Sigma-70, region 4/HB1, ASXL, restriction endonuclease HTH domain
MKANKLNSNPKALTKKLLKDMPERTKQVISRRFGLDDAQSETLQAIGNDYKLTRERVRQIEQAGMKAIKESKLFMEATEIFDELKKHLSDIGGASDTKSFTNHVTSDAILQNHVHFYLVLGDDFIQKKEGEMFKNHWILNDGSLESLYEIMKDLYTTMDDETLLEQKQIIEQVLKHKKAGEISKKYPINNNVIEKWLSITHAIGKNHLGLYGKSDSPHIKTRGVSEMAYLLMRQHGSPMHFREVTESILTKFGKKINTATVHNELIRNENFVLIGRGLYALREWGYKEGTARDVITDILNREKRGLTKDEILERVMKERHLRENTIYVNLHNKKYFTRAKDGTYTAVPQPPQDPNAPKRRRGRQQAKA